MTASDSSLSANDGKHSPPAMLIAVWFRLLRVFRRLIESIVLPEEPDRRTISRILGIGVLFVTTKSMARFPDVVTITITILLALVFFLTDRLSPKMYALILIVAATIGALLHSSTPYALSLFYVIVVMSAWKVPLPLGLLPAAWAAGMLVVSERAPWNLTSLLQTLGVLSIIFIGTWSAQARRLSRTRMLIALADLERANAELRSAHAQLQLDSSRAAELAAAEERERIAREIHDVLAHTLTVLVVQVGAAKRLVRRDPEQALAQLDVIAQLARDGLTEARRSVHDLRTPQEAGVSATQTLVDEYSQRTGVQTTFAVDDGLPTLPPDVSKALYRVTQEALTNAVRHGQASAVSVGLRREGDDLVLRVHDNGAGAAAEQPVAGGGNGLPGARARLEKLGGRLDAGPDRDGGFTLIATLPLANVQVIRGVRPETSADNHSAVSAVLETMPLG